MMRHNKKGVVLLLETIIGIILGLGLLIFLFTLVSDILTHQEDWEGSYNDLATSLKTVMEEGSINEIESALVKLEDESAIIGLSPVAAQPNGRFGDGNFRLMGGTYQVTGGSHYSIQASIDRYAVHFNRPDVCSPNNACLCLCQHPRAVTTNYQEPSLQSTDSTPYDEGPLKDNKKEFLSIVQRTHYNITCTELQCTQLSPHAFESPLDGTHFTSSGVVYENGFLLYRGDKKDFGYKEKLPASIPLFMGKIPGATLAVCMDTTCFETFN
jgi:hypothetical protein